MSNLADGNIVLQQLSDKQEIQQLANAYSHAVMRLDGVAAAQVYADNGVLSAFRGPDIIGRAAIADALVMTLEPLRFLSQTCAAGMIEINGDTARASWSVSELLQHKDKEPLSCCFGNYDDDLVRTPDGWRFARRRFNPFFRGSIKAEGREYDAPENPHQYAAWPLP